jgi:hypothetical protein
VVISHVLNIGVVAFVSGNGNNYNNDDGENIRNLFWSCNLINYVNWHTIELVRQGVGYVFVG